MTARPIVWIVGASALESEAVRRSLGDDFAIEIFTDGSGVLDRATLSTPDLLVLDWALPGASTVELCRSLRAHNPQLAVLLLTAHGDDVQLAAGLGAGANDFIARPFSALELTVRVGALIATRRAHERADHADDERAGSERERADAAEERARLSELYVGIVGHDLVNPLSAITLAATALASRTEDEESRKLANSIRLTARRTMEMTRALLDVTRLRLGGGLELVRRRGDLGALCRQLVGEMRTAFPGRDIELRAADDPIELTFDAARVSQVVWNLVSNALGHGSPDAPVLLTVERRGGEVHLRVTNEGPPMAPELLARLFDPFHRGGATTNRGEGLGLGLYITQQIVAAHGGTIDVESADVTTFTVRLPA